MQQAGYLQRQVLTDTGQRIHGYFFQMRGAGGDSGAAVLCQFIQRDQAWPLGKSLLWIDATAATLADPIIDQAPPRNIVFLVGQRQLADAGFIRRCKELKACGFRFGIADCQPHGTDAGSMNLAGFLGINIARLGTRQAAAAARLLERPGVQLIATHTDAPSHYQWGRQAGISRFQGNYFLRPTYNAARQPAANHARIIELLDRVQKGSNDGEIEALLKMDAALSFRVLKYLNAAGFGLSCEVESIRHAIQILGRNELYRWLTLLLVTAGTAAPPALTKTAIVRGRFCELLGKAIHLPGPAVDSLFITGVFSLLDAMLEMPLEQALEHLVLAGPINDALLDGSGLYAPFLQLAAACESDSPLSPGDIAAPLGLSAGQVNTAMLAAMAWAEALGL
jgi:c-di-GMP phosphodiesterase